MARCRIAIRRYLYGQYRVKVTARRAACSIQTVLFYAIVITEVAAPATISWLWAPPSVHRFQIKRVSPEP